VTAVVLSVEQRAIVAHRSGRHARVLAGPGTGKSFTATMLLAELLTADAGLRAKMLTFTRAATAEFAEKLGEAGLAEAVGEPSTVHAHALSVLMGMEGHGLPSPLRIPDSWETKQLVHPHLSRILKGLGYPTATPGLVQDLEREMAAGWETLDVAAVLLTDLDPNLRAAYVNAWQAHRRAFGYALLAELPYQAGMALTDLGDDNPPKVDVLLVDEYQDLNAADIAFVEAHAILGVTVIAIGDDDQSIYGWRHADPAGIRRFCEQFAGAADYTLTESRRCGSRILAAANELIATAPDRAPKQPLRPGPNSPPGSFAYLRFATGVAEAAGAAAIAATRVRDGVDPGDVLLLVRSLDDRWRQHLEPHFAATGLTIASTGWVDDAMADPLLRVGIALGRLFQDREDSLAWWALIESLTPQIGPAFTGYVYDERRPSERWGTALLRLHGGAFPGLGRAAATRATNTIRTVLSRLDELEETTVAGEDGGWADWLMGELGGTRWSDVFGLPALTKDGERLLDLVGPHVPPSEGLAGLLNRLEPVGRDLAAAESGGVRLMSMAKSKGLTVDTAIVLGVEEHLVPFPRGGNEDEERRLLYVAMTRASRMCVLTSASRRTGPLARSGSGATYRQRGRSPLLAHLSYGRPADGDTFIQNL
jgi:DNA helicase-2/ATP-dependent DNA helicase PcrA